MFSKMNPLRPTTPHLGASTNEAQENVGIQVAEQIRDFCATGEIRNAINMPSLDAAALSELGGYLDIARALGKLLAKLGPANPDSLRVSYHGALAEKDTALISRSVLCSFLEAARCDGQINIVNAPGVAKELGTSSSFETTTALELSVQLAQLSATPEPISQISPSQEICKKTMHSP